MILSRKPNVFNNLWALCVLYCVLVLLLLSIGGIGIAYREHEDMIVV